jgi:transcriptional regulator with XRE-family HTH domain
MTGMKTFAKHLSRLREQKDMTRYRLAQLSGISKEGISKLESSGSDPKLSTLVKLARALGIKTWELLPDWPGNEPKSTTVDHDADAKPAAKKNQSKSTTVDQRSKLSRADKRKSGFKPNSKWGLWITDTGEEAMPFVDECLSLLDGPKRNRTDPRLLGNLAKIEAILKRKPRLPIADRALKHIAELVKILPDADDHGKRPLYCVEKLSQLLRLSDDDMVDLVKEWEDPLDDEDDDN